MTDAPEAPRQEREALARQWRHIAPNADDVRAYGYGGAMAALAYDELIAAGYVTPEAHAAALREAWEAGRDAVIAEAKRGIAEIEASPATDYLRAKIFALYQLANIASRLTPPAPKGDDR